MLEFLQSGKALSVLAVIGLIGLVSKLITRNLYRRLLKDTENMAMTRNKNLKLLKQKLENTYRVNQNIVNTKAYLDKLMYEFRFLRLSLDTWDNVSRQMVLLGLLAGGAGSFFSYWYQIDASYIVMYASAAALAGLFLIFVDSSVNISQKKQKLETVLLEYVDNSVFVRAARENSGRERRQLPADRERETRTEEERQQLIHENEVKDGLVRETSPRQSPVRPFRNRNSKAEDLLRTVRGMKDSESREEELSGSSPARRDIDSLKQSLEQIAASRESLRETVPRGVSSPESRDWTKHITEEEMKLIGELMRQYFAGTK